MKTDTLLEQVLESPKMGLYFQEIQHIFEEERQKRQHFYDTIIDHDKAEFINGEVIMHSPVRLEHTVAAGFLLVLLKTYVDKHDLGFVGHEKIMIPLTRSDYEPDLCFFHKSKASQFTSGQWQFPAPDLIVEILSDSTEQIDRETKFIDYAAHGVQEYWIIDPAAESVEQSILQEGQDAYALLIKAKTGKITSVAIPGFEIPIRAIFDRAENQKALHQIINEMRSS